MEAGPLNRTLFRIVGSSLGLLRTWRRRAIERAFLARLDDRALRDLGITRVDVARECAKPFWRG